MSDLPILYSFRRCPYAIRARMTLAYSGVAVELREVLLKDKPVDLLNASSKGTVPVLCLPDGVVLDESLAIMRWSLAQSDPDCWLDALAAPAHLELVQQNDGPFKAWLDQYKYADRHPEHPEAWYRDQALPFLQQLNGRLETNRWLQGPRMQVTDVALFPFIRQFAMVDRAWFDSAALDDLRCWLGTMLELPLFRAVMARNKPWEAGQAPVIFAP